MRAQRFIDLAYPSTSGSIVSRDDRAGCISVVTQDSRVRLRALIHLENRGNSRRHLGGTLRNRNRGSRYGARFLLGVRRLVARIRADVRDTFEVYRHRRHLLGSSKDPSREAAPQADGTDGDKPRERQRSSLFLPRWRSEIFVNVRASRAQIDPERRVREIDAPLGTQVPQSAGFLQRPQECVPSYCQFQSRATNHETARNPAALRVPDFLDLSRRDATE